MRARADKQQHHQKQHQLFNNMIIKEGGQQLSDAYSEAYLAARKGLPGKVCVWRDKKSAQFVWQEGMRKVESDSRPVHGREVVIVLGDPHSQDSLERIRQGGLEMETLWSHIRTEGGSGQVVHGKWVKQAGATLDMAGTADDTLLRMINRLVTCRLQTSNLSQLAL